LLSRIEVIVKTIKAELPIINDIAGSDSVFITAPEPERYACPFSRAEIARNLGLTEGEFDSTRDVAIINGGLRTLIVPLRTNAAVLTTSPHEDRLREFSIASDHFDVIIVFTDETVHPDNRFRTRVFCPKYGYLEDPATGSGNAALGYYLLERSLWDGDIFSIEQGPDRQNPNIIKVRAFSINGVKRVQVGGKGVVRFERRLQL
jgi:PhzF family phenazine biosynthesis protein